MQNVTAEQFAPLYETVTHLMESKLQVSWTSATWIFLLSTSLIFTWHFNTAIKNLTPCSGVRLGVTTLRFRLGISLIQFRWS